MSRIIMEEKQLNYCNDPYKAIELYLKLRNVIKVGILKKMILVLFILDIPTYNKNSNVEI